MNETLRWSIGRTTSALQIDYTYENHTDKPVLVHDARLVQVADKLWKPTPSVVWEVAQPGTLLVTAGIPGDDGAAPPRGIYKSIPPGGSHQASVSIPLPLVSLGLGGGSPITGITQIQFETLAVHGEPSYIELPIAGGTIKIPDGPVLREVRSPDVKPLPK